MPELLIDAPNPIAALGLVDRLESSSFRVHAGGELSQVRVAASPAALPHLLGIVHGWLDAYDLHQTELAIGTRRYRLGGQAGALPDAAPPDELPDDVVLDA